MIDTSKVHPLFDAILAEHFSQQPHEDVDRTVKPQRRATRNEDYLEYHEDREELGIRHSDYGIKGWF